MINVIYNLDIPIYQLEILSASERQELLFELNQTNLDYQCDKCIDQLFAEQAEKTPDQIAVVFENEEITYQ